MHGERCKTKTTRRHNSRDELTKKSSQRQPPSPTTLVTALLCSRPQLEEEEEEAVRQLGRSQENLLLDRNPTKAAQLSSMTMFLYQHSQIRSGGVAPSLVLLSYLLCYVTTSASSTLFVVDATATSLTVPSSSEMKQLKQQGRSLQGQQEDDDGAYTTYVLDSDSDRGFASVCEPDLPPAFSVIAEQRVSFEYTMYLVQGSNADPLGKVLELEQRMQMALSRFFLQCENVNAQLFYINSILSFPPDVLLYECHFDEGDADTPKPVEGADCYRAKAQFTVEIAYQGNERRHRQRRKARQLQLDFLSNLPTDSLPDEIPEELQGALLSEILEDPELRQYLTENFVDAMMSGDDISQWLDDPMLVSYVGDFLVDLLEDGELIDSDIVGLLFNGFVNGNVAPGQKTVGAGDGGDILASTPAPRTYVTVAGASSQQYNTEESRGYTRVVPFIAVGVAALILFVAMGLVARQKTKNLKRQLRAANNSDEEAATEANSSNRRSPAGKTSPPLEDTVSGGSMNFDDDGMVHCHSSSRRKLSFQPPVDDIFVLSDLQAADQEEPSFPAHLHQYPTDTSLILDEGVDGFEVLDDRAIVGPDENGYTFSCTSSLVSGSTSSKPALGSGGDMVRISPIKPPKKDLSRRDENGSRNSSSLTSSFSPLTPDDPYSV